MGAWQDWGKKLCFKRDQNVDAFKIPFLKKNPKLFWLWKLFLFLLMIQKHFYLPFLTLICESCSIGFWHKKCEKTKPEHSLIFPVSSSISLAHTHGISHISRIRMKLWSQRGKQNYLLNNNRMENLIAN